MPLSNNLASYDAITANTKIQFKAGTQASLNTMIANGTAVEGTFYLTTDTHKLYIGRKKTVGGTAKVYPEQVSRGVTVVGTSSELPTPPANAPAGAIEEGELFYITDTNVLAALRKKAGSDPVTYEWVQINPPTGISEVITAAVASGNAVDIRTVISTGAGDQPGAFKVTAGDNITLAAGTGTVDLGTAGNKAGQGNLTISATDTVYQAGVETNTSKGVIGLKSKTSGSFGSTLDSVKIDIEGTNSVAVTSNATGNKVTVAGPNFTGIAVENSTTDGFGISLEGTKGDGTNLGVSGLFAPHIKYGATSTYADPASTVTFDQNTQVGFVNGTATLNVYTKPQADQAIKDAIDSKMATANAMTYRGVVTSANASGDASSLWAQVQANGAHNGDTYKVSAVNSSSAITINGQTAKVGDLIIISGAETNGVVPIPSNNINGLLSVCDLIPSGDEPEFVATPLVSATRDTFSGFSIADGKVANSNLLTTKLFSGNKIDITSELDSTDTTGKTENITIAHSTTGRTDSTTETLAVDSTSTTDTIGSSKLKLFVLSGETTSNKVKGIKTDDYGHVTGVEGKIITFQHNYVDAITVEYGVSSIGITANNNISGFNSTTGLLNFHSSTLQIAGDTVNSRLDIDLVWGTF